MPGSDANTWAKELNTEAHFVNLRLPFSAENFKQKTFSQNILVLQRKTYPPFFAFPPPLPFFAFLGILINKHDCKRPSTVKTIFFQNGRLKSVVRFLSNVCLQKNTDLPPPHPTSYLTSVIVGGEVRTCLQLAVASVALKPLYPSP